ncbi:MAG TPA: glycosyltransferase family 2 protein, partial [Gammaproteobacteria bacterium]|nr:glycosyltransferase family 2 protein [Gammaproteobacteria bacterium]
QMSGCNPKVHILSNGKNLGFSRANNIAIQRARGRYVLLLNPDCIVNPDTLPQMLKVMESDPTAGMAGCLIRNPDGSEQPGCRRAVPTPWRTFVRIMHLYHAFPHHPRFRSFLLHNDPLPKDPTPVESISGAFMLVRRSAIEQVGTLDEGYFMHCEDLDWCMRFSQAGWKILFVPSVEVIHFKGSCSKERPIRVIYHMHRGMVRFYRKFFQHHYSWPLMGLVALAVWVRFAILCIKELSTFPFQKVPTYSLTNPTPTETERLPTSPMSNALPDEKARRKTTT